VMAKIPRPYTNSNGNWDRGQCKHQ